jgi:hypothetical protein
MKRLVLVVALLALLAGSAAARESRAGSFSPFATTWHIHGFNLQVTSNGSAYAVYRTYVFCSNHRHFGCDRIVGNNLYSGGLWYAQLRNPSSTQVSGTIYASAESALDGSTIQLSLRPQGMLLLTQTANGHTTQIKLCGPQTPNPGSQCGA